jgi:hypothetical protein
MKINGVVFNESKNAVSTLNGGDSKNLLLNDVSIKCLIAKINFSSLNSFTSNNLLKSCDIFSNASGKTSIWGFSHFKKSLNFLISS